MSSRGDFTGALIMLGIFVVPAFIRLIIEKIQDVIQKKAQDLCDQKVESIRAPLLKDIETYKHKTLFELQTQRQFVQELRDNFSIDYIAGRKWLARFIAEAEKPVDDVEVARLRNKKRPALSSAEAVKAARQEKRDAIEKLKFLEFQLASYKEYFPILEEYEEVILNERMSFKDEVDLNHIGENVDRTKLFVSEEEYKKLSESERNQIALDRYLKREKSKWEIGRYYERYVGYQYETEDWQVDYIGAIKGFEDMGRDLICKKGSDIHIVQAKCWAAEKVIREKHIFQLFGTSLAYELENNLPLGTVRSVFVTTTKLSDVAEIAAKRLGVHVKHIALSFDYPLIKCNINQGSKIYHLPFDQQYDRVRISKDGECYTKTVVEAEKKGFRRAWRHLGNKS